MKKLIVHPGSPKTATSSLQFILRTNRGRLEKEGIGLILPEDIRGRDFLGQYLLAYRDEASADILEAAHEFYEPYVSRFDTVVFSEETLCHDHMPSRRTGFGGIDRSEMAAELIAQNPFDTTEIVLTIRPQISLLISTYTHFVHRHREARSFFDWLNAEVDLEHVLWTPAIDAFADRFASVEVISMAPDGTTDMDAYLRCSLSALGLGAFDLPLFTDEVHNPSPSDRAVQLCSIMNGMITNPGKSIAVNTFLVENFSVREFGKFRPDWKLPSFLADLYHDDHDRAIGRARTEASC